MKKRFMVLLMVVVLVFSPCVAFATDEAVEVYSAESSIFGGINDIYQSVKNIFVPREDYFYNKISELNKLTHSRFAGLASLYRILDNFFVSLANPPPIGLTLDIPDGYFYDEYDGISVNFYSSVYPYMTLIRDVTGAAISLFTVITCYHKIRTFFDTGVTL